MFRPSRLTLIVLPILTLILGIQVGVLYEQKQVRLLTRPVHTGEQQTGTGRVLTDPEHEVDISLLWTTWRTLLEHYIAPQELRTDSMVYGAISGMVRGVGDPYTLFMTPKENEDFRQELGGKLHGIGAELSLKNGLIIVVAPLKGSPAAKAGLLPKDIITEVDKKPLEGLELDDVVRRIRGPEGTSVTLTVIRDSEAKPITMNIVRREITIPSVESSVVETRTGKLGYIALNQFGDTAPAEIKAAATTLQKEPIKGLILDLRFNGGGYLDGAVDIASLFLKEGVVVTVARRGNNVTTHHVTGSPLLPELPMAVLINEGSASASEIVAGALQDLGRAKIIGMKSYGKGTVQEVIDLPGGASLRVTTARWLTPKGKNLGKEGVHPDIVIDRSREDFEAKRDPQLEAAKIWLLENRDVTKKQ